MAVEVEATQRILRGKESEKSDEKVKVKGKMKEGRLALIIITQLD